MMSYNKKSINTFDFEEYNKLKIYYEEQQRKREKRRLLYMLKKYGSIENGTKKQKVI